ncbi:30S ribosomal protein S5 [Candidatus Woesearchaeota archaeon]|nr:MAG: 30S ribosomal protein S5 [Candidatus Woesearchaeota archaeon]
MVEEEKKNVKVEDNDLEIEKEEIVEAPEEIEKAPEVKIDVDAWKPKTELGRKVKSGEVSDIDFILDKGLPILECEIVDVLLPGLETELLLSGQSKGKFGGGSRRVFRQTQKKTPEGNKPSFACIVAVGNKDGYVGIGFGKSKDTVPAREKAIRQAKLNIFKIRRGCGSWEDSSNEPHSIPFAVQGKCGSVVVKLMPAPKGKGLVVEKELAKILSLAGISNIYSKTFGRTSSKSNLVNACVSALKKLSAFKISKDVAAKVGMIEGRVQ